MDKRINHATLQGSSETKKKHYHNPAVSIVTVVFNAKELLEKTILSIRNQTFKNIEYIIIDGKSSDGTIDVIKKYESFIDYWISEPDKGIYDAMNKALHIAKGNYIWFLNAGDLIESADTLEKMFIVSADADVIYGETKLINSKDEVLGTRSELTTRRLPKHMTSQDMKYGMVVSHQSILVKRSLAPEYNLKYKFSSDIDWVITSLKRSKKTVNANAVLSRYLIGGVSIKNQKQSLKERFFIYIHHFGILATLGAHIFILVNALKHGFSGKKNY